MENIETITLSEDTKCSGCSVVMKKGDSVVKYDDKDIGGIYHFQGCLDAYVDYCIESGMFEPVIINPKKDPILQKLRAKFGVPI